MMEYEKQYAEAIVPHIQHVLKMEDVQALIEHPKRDGQGDLAFPCFVLARHLRTSPKEIAVWLADRIHSPLFEKVVADGPYVNGFLDKAAVSGQLLQHIQQERKGYGTQTWGLGKTITLDFSSPNIAKPFSMGHLRSTVIGNAMANIVEKCGYTPVKINHVGDWGTQFGKLMVAYTRWGSEEQVQRDTIKELLDLYVLFHEKAEAEPHLKEEARQWFRKLEQGDEEASRLWRWFRYESLQEFSKIYDLLGIAFDTYQGEAFYNDHMEGVAQLIQEKGLLETSEGAEVVDLSDHQLPPCLIRKSDGATLYATRDLAAAIYRHQQYEFDQSYYIVGDEQRLHFQQLFLVLEKMGYDWAKGMVHIPFGFILQNGKKMSTRKGKVILLEEVIQEAIDLAQRSIEDKNPELGQKEETARKVGVGAIIFHDLKHERQNNIEFQLEDMLRFEGTTGPYVQYTHARACSILRKAGYHPSSVEQGLTDAPSWNVIKTLAAFPAVIERSYHQSEPSVIAKYLIHLSQSFNKYYSQVRIRTKDEELPARLALVHAVAIVLQEGLRILGVQAPEEM